MGRLRCDRGAAHPVQGHLSQERRDASRRSGDNRVQIDAGRTLIAGSKPTRQGGQRLNPILGDSSVFVNL